MSASPLSSEDRAWLIEKLGGMTEDERAERCGIKPDWWRLKVVAEGNVRLSLWNKIKDDVKKYLAMQAAATGSMPAFASLDHKALSTSQTYEVLQDLVWHERIEHAKVMQLSASWSKPLLRAMLQFDTKIDLYIQHPQASITTSDRLRILEFIGNIYMDLDVQHSGHQSELRVHLYQTNPKNRRVYMLDDRVVALSDIHRIEIEHDTGHPFVPRHAHVSTLAQSTYQIFEPASNMHAFEQAKKDGDAAIRAALQSQTPHCVSPAIVISQQKITFCDKDLRSYLEQVEGRLRTLTPALQR